MKVLLSKKLKMLCHEHILQKILMRRDYWNLLRKRTTKNKSKKNIRIEKLIKRKSNKLKWKGCDNSSNSWIDKEDIVT